MMEFHSYQNRLSQLSARFNLMVFLVFGLLISNGLLAGLVWFTSYHQRIEITPFFSGEGYQKSAASLDAHYLGLMSENFIYSRLNITPETVSSNFQRLATYVNAANYAELMKLLNREAQLVKSKQISSAFTITDMQINLEALTVDVYGILQRHVGLRELPAESLTYRLSYSYQLGRIAIKYFKQIKPMEEEKNNG